MIRVLFVDKHEMFRTAVATLINETETIRVVAQAQTGKEAILKAKNYSPDVVLLEYLLPDMDGAKVIEEIHENNPRQKVIILTGEDEESKMIDKMLESGAYSFHTKHEQIDELVNTIKDAYAVMSTSRVLSS